MVALNLNRQESINSDSAGSHKKSEDIGRNKRISLETKFIFLALLVAGLFLVVTNSSIVTYANMNIAKMSSHEKLKRDFLRSTDKTPKVIGVDSANNENEDIPVARQEYEKLKRDFLDSTGKQEEDLTMTIITKSSDADTFCACAIVSVDCLDSVNCIPTQAASLRDVATGILLRSLIKQTATFEGSADIRNSRVPMGKGFQYKTITAWYSWAKYNKLPSEHDPYPSYIFLQNAKKKHQMCADNNLFGFQCYFTAINEKEEFDSLEAEALRYHHHLLKTELDLEQHMLHQLRDIQAAVSEDKGNEIHALDHLRIFANILRMLFNRNEPLRELSSQTRVFNANERGQSQKESDATPLKVSIHIRRADACMAEGKLVPESSPLDSCAQQFAQRICYATSVYMDALRRLRDIMSKRDPTRRIEVFISSDDASNMMDEIEGQFPDLYLSMTWHILDFDRERFNYKGFVEGYDHKNHNLLGEAAAADLWLLSNGEVFIGHLGSRFGKVAYLLATARHNRFVPFFSVDGHSVCCEIDEPCGEMKPYIKSMSDCLTFSHDQVSDDYGYEINEDYFDVGSYMRKIVAQAQSLPGDESYKVEVASGVGHGSGGDGEKQIQTTPTPTTDKTEEKTDQWPWADLTAPVADYKYFPETRRRQSVDEPVFLLDKHCSSLVLDTSPPIVRPPSNGSCDGFDGVLHIRQGDVGGAAGTIFFVFLLGQLQYAEQFNLKPWVHLNSESEKVYDPLVHDQGEQRKFTMMDGMDISWARDARDPDGYLFPGRPRHKRPGRLRQKEFSVEGTGVWNHYFLPVSDFSPGDPSCENKPILTFDHDMIAPGIHYQSPWAPMVWRVGDIAHINRNDLDFDVWIEPKRRNAAKLVKNYIRFNAEIQQRAECAHPKQENSLGIHIRHSDKEVTRGGAIALSNFFPYAQAFVEHGGGSIFVATDSSLVIDEIRSKWPSDITSHVVYQVGTILSHNDTATFELGISHHRINVEALTDILALSKCTYLVHGLSALSEAAIYLNPSLIERSINLEQYDQDDKAKYANFLKMISE